MLIQERGIGVVVLHLHFEQVCLVAPVQALDVLLHCFLEFFPLELLLLIDFPALQDHVFSAFGQDGGVVHHLLGDAAYVDAGASKAPRLPLG